MQDRQAIRAAIAARLTKARKQAGYSSAKDFCEKNELSLEQYLACEKGKVMINASKAIRYCSLLNISLKSLLIG